MRKFIVSFIFLSSSLMASNDYTFMCWLNSEYEKSCTEYDMLLENPLPKDRIWQEKFFMANGKLMAYSNVINEVNRLISPDQKKRFNDQKSSQLNSH